MSWAEERFEAQQYDATDAARSPMMGPVQEDLEAFYKSQEGGLRVVGEMVARHKKRRSPMMGGWHCHDCADGGLTPHSPEIGCDRYPCHALIRPSWVM